MIKYLGSKRNLVPVLGELFTRSGARTALDLFTGTTRVAQEFCRRGAFVHANDLASYSYLFSQTYVETQPGDVDPAELADALERLSALPDRRGYLTETFCEQAHYFQPHNGVRLDAIRAGIDEWYADSPLRPLLLTSLIEAADRVDSTVGLQMAYLKDWSARSHNPLRLRPPGLVPGTGQAHQRDAADLLTDLPRVDFAYLDPPYNQHRYYTNYHIWETLVRGDAPEHYGKACKRADAREAETKSPWNSRRTMPAEFARVLEAVPADVIVVSFSNEGFVPLAELVEMCAGRGEVRVLDYAYDRYVGARLGIYSPQGVKVGTVSHTRNVEHVLVCGEPDRVLAMTEGLAA